MLSGLGDHGKIQSKHRFCPRKSITLHNVCAIHRGMFSTLGGYHEYTRGCSVQRGFHTNSIVVPITSPYIIMISLGVLNTPQCTHEIPRYTEHPPLYCTPPGVLHRHYAGCQFCSTGDQPHEKKIIFQYAIPKVNMLHNLSCCEMRFRLLCRWYLLHSSLNLAFRESKLHNILFSEWRI